MNIYSINNQVSSNKNIIYIHGNSSSSNVFKPVLDVNSPYHMCAFDLPGHGQSTFSNNVNHYNFEHYKKISLAQIKQLHGEVLLVGNSLGGNIAIEIAPQIENLKGLLIMGTPPIKRPLNLEEAIIPNDALPVFMTEYPTNEEIDNAMTLGVYNPKKRQRIKDDFLASAPKIRSAIAADISNENLANEYEIFIQLNCLKMIIQGRQEPTVNSLYLSSLAEQSKADLIYIDECAHYPTLEQPIQFLKHLNTFALKCFSS